MCPNAHAPQQLEASGFLGLTSSTTPTLVFLASLSTSRAVVSRSHVDLLVKDPTGRLSLARRDVLRCPESNLPHPRVPSRLGEPKGAAGLRALPSEQGSALARAVGFGRI